MTAPYDLTISCGCIVTMNSQREIIHDGLIAVRGGKILALGRADELGPVPARKHINAPKSLVIPGFIDSHNHPIHFLSKGICDEMPVQRRWRERVWPYEAQLSAADARLAATGTFIEMIRNGTTCFNDPGTFQPDAVAEAAIETGIRGVVARLAWDVRDPTAPDYDDTTEEAVAKSAATVEKWHGAGGGRLKGSFSLVRSAHVSDALCRTIKRRADAINVNMHGHLCTTRQEVELARQNTGMTPVERYRRLGLLGSNLILVHMGWVDADEIPVLAENDVSVCHCPSASMLGGFGCISHGKFPEMVEADVRIVLGSDACAISRFVDMVRVMYLAACGHKDARTDPTVIGAHKAMEMATVDAARALLWNDQIGSLEPGKCADIAIIDAAGPTWHPNPFANPIGNLIYSASGASVCTVVIDGKVVMENRHITTIDEEAFLVEADAASRRVLAHHAIEIGPQWPQRTRARNGNETGRSINAGRDK